MFDKVVVATHADEALRLLSDPSAEEQRLLSTWSYSVNQTVVHTDESLLSKSRTLRASWNSIVRDCEQPSKQISLSYFLNNLQDLDEPKSYIVTLNPHVAIDERCVIKRSQYTVPVFSRESVATQTELPSLSGVRNTYFCGAYFRNGFHEDGVMSGVEVARSLGVEFP